MAVPDAPTTLIPTIDDESVSISWTVPSDNGSAITDYNIQYSTNGETWNTFADGVSTTASATVTGLTNGQLYLFRVRAVNADGNGPYSDIAIATPLADREPEYCNVNQVADWLRVDINANTNPNKKMVKEFIMMNEDIIDRKTGHTWRAEKQYRTDTFSISDIYDYGRGMYIPLKHRSIKPWDATKGDKFEVWNGREWVEHVDPTNSLINVEDSKGSLHVKGYFYSILRQNRFRLTYRYGGDKEGESIPRDIRKCAVLMTAIDIISTDFKMSQIAYGGEGNIAKGTIVQKWQDEIDGIIWDHSEILTVW